MTKVRHNLSRKVHLFMALNFSFLTLPFLEQKLSAGLTAKTERNLAQRAGHLELLAGGKKDGKGKKEGGKKGSSG